MYTDKNKGGLTAFIIIIISFVSWAVFTSSLMLSGEISLRTDSRDIISRKNKELFWKSFLKKQFLILRKKFPKIISVILSGILQKKTENLCGLKIMKIFLCQREDMKFIRLSQESRKNIFPRKMVLISEILLQKILIYLN